MIRLPSFENSANSTVSDLILPSCSEDESDSATITEPTFTIRFIPSSADETTSENETTQDENIQQQQHKLHISSSFESLLKSLENAFASWFGFI